MNYFNEIDPYAAQWLRNLIDAGHIAPGIVDTRSIVDVTPGDLTGFRQCHFFAGVGVWSLALRRAGVPDDADVWTGSCPCQPFSAAGKGDGMDDERHLWPHLEHLIRQRRPAVVLGEQVASKDADPWLDLVQTDLEALGYAFGAVAFPSAGIGAPHIRDRTYWVANANRGQCDGFAVIGGNERVGHDAGRTQECGEPQPCGDLCGLADTNDRSKHALLWGAKNDPTQDVWRCAAGGSLGHLAQGIGSESGGFREPTEQPTGPTNGLWRDADWLLCRDGKWRPVEPGTFPLVDGSAGHLGRVRADQERLAALAPRKDQGSRVGRLKGYGNAINVAAAEAWVRCAMQP